MLRLDFDRAWATWPVFFKSCLILMDRMDRELQAEAGLPLSWFEVLNELASTPRGMMPMKQLAEAVCLTKSGASRLIDRMEDNGLVRRVACEHDGRVIFAALTPEGRTAYEQARPHAYRCVEEHFARYITPEEAIVINAALSKILSSTHCSSP